MSRTLKQVQELAAQQNILISDHGYDELASDDIFVQDVIEGVADVAVIKDYPDYHKGPCVLVLQFDKQERPIHVVWGGTKTGIVAGGSRDCLPTRSSALD